MEEYILTEVTQSDRPLVGDKMHLMPPVCHCHAQFSGNYATASESWIAYYAYIHDVRIFIKGNNAWIGIRLCVWVYTK